MKKILIILILLTLAVSSRAFAASARWDALGGDHRFIIDTTNYTIYPGRVTLFGNALFIIPVPKADTKPKKNCGGVCPERRYGFRFGVWAGFFFY